MREEQVVLEDDADGALLDRSEQVQGSRKEIRKLRKEAERRCGDGDEG